MFWDEVNENNSSLFDTNNTEDLRQYILNYVGTAYNAVPDCDRGRLCISAMLGDIESASRERLIEIAEMLEIL